MKTKLLIISLLVLAIVGTSTAAWAAAPKKDTLNVTANTSDNGVTPTVPGQAPNQWFYAYCLPSGSSLSDTLPISFSVSDTNGTSGQSYTITLSAVGSPALKSGTTVPANFAISDDGSTTSKTITISTGTLADGNYNLNIQVSSDPPGQLNVPHDTIHIQVTVGGTCITPVINCFFTSSDFTFLTDCSGGEVTGSSGGTFLIVPNAKGKVVATNPGQFYYNAIWLNTGSSRPVVINLSQTGLTTMGANSVHALTFNATGFTADVSAFDMVNTDGTPCGPQGPCTVTVNSGDVLWVTWHLQYGGIGSPSAGISNSCPGNQTIFAQLTLTEVGGSEIGICGATATGYLKQ